MKKALFFVSYHPGSLVELDYIRKLDRQSSPHKSLHVLIICSHPYVNSEIIELYSGEFDHAIVLPLVKYEMNLARGFSGLKKMLKIFHEKIEPILKNIDNFNIISDFSAYLPVNTVMTQLKRNKKCRRLISIRGDYRYKFEIDILKTLWMLFYTSFFRLSPVWRHRMFSCMYVREPYDKIILFKNRFARNPGEPKIGSESVPVYYVCPPPIEECSEKRRDIVIIYTDRDFRAYSPDLTKEEYERKMRPFFSSLAQHYKEYNTICKPHPSDNDKVMPWFKEFGFEVYNGGLTTQMHLNENVSRVWACYSVSSTSLLYSASLGIPSYALYKYAGLNGKYPGEFFESDEARKNPFLYRIENEEQIGIIDAIDVKPVENDTSLDWEEVMS